MGQLVLWALATGFVAGATWFGIPFEIHTIHHSARLFPANVPGGAV
jgi:hypothetical protein